jgi:hypothetical protein
MQQWLKEVMAHSKNQLWNWECPQSGSEHVKITWFGVQKLIPNVQSVLQTRFWMDPYYMTTQIHVTQVAARMCDVGQRARSCTKYMKPKTANITDKVKFLRGMTWMSQWEWPNLNDAPGCFDEKFQACPLSCACTAHSGCGICSKYFMQGLQEATYSWPLLRN